MFLVSGLLLTTLLCWFQLSFGQRRNINGAGTSVSSSFRFEDLNNIAGKFAYHS